MLLHFAGRISVFAFVCKLRKERPLMVRTLKQYIFIYECLLEQFHAGNIMINAMCFKEKYHSWNLKNSKTGMLCYKMFNVVNFRYQNVCTLLLY